MLCRGLESSKKLSIPKSMLLKSGITMRTADGKPLTVLGVIPVVVTMTDSEINTVTEFLIMIAELSS